MADPRRILFVDDEPDVRSFVEHVLRHAGYDVELAEDGEVALEKLRAGCPDLMILDLMMPRLDGWGVLEGLASLAERPPVIMLTARDDFASFSRAFQHGAVAFVNKPFRFGHLLATCERVFSGAPQPVEDERRAVPRRLVGMGVRVLSDQGVPLALGELIELSPLGARVRVDTPRDVGSRLWLALYMSAGQTVLRLGGTIRWCREDADGHLIGVELEGLSPADQSRLDELFRDSD